MGWWMHTVAAPSHYLIVTGLNSPDIEVEKEAYLWLGQSCRDLDINPVSYPFDVQAMSVERLLFTVPLEFIIGPRDDMDSLKRFAKGDRSASHLTILIKGIVEREVRLLAAGMPIEHALGGTREFLKELSDKVQLGLDQYELHIYNTNITQLPDLKRKKAQEEMANQAKVDVGEAEEIITAPEADAFLHNERAKADALCYSERKEANTLAFSKHQEVKGACPMGPGGLYADERYCILPQEAMPRSELKHQLHPLGRWDQLPARIVAMALSKTTPRDVCRLAAVNKRFAKAANSDQVWRAFLPVDIEEILKAVQDGAPVCRREKDLYNHLTNHVVLGHGTAGYFLDRATGEVCRTFSASTLGMAWGDDSKYWKRGPSEGSRFREVAFLEGVCWLHIYGTINCRVPPGTYTLSWVFKFDSVKRFGWEAPITFSSTDETQVYENTIPQRSRSRSDPSSSAWNRTIADEWLERRDRNRDGWWEYNVGNFTVTKTNDAENVGELHLRFDMKATDPDWKGGLYIDGVIVRSILTT